MMESRRGGGIVIAFSIPKGTRLKEDCAVTSTYMYTNTHTALHCLLPPLLLPTYIPSFIHEDDGAHGGGSISIN